MRTRPRSSLLLWSGLSCLAGLTVLRFALLSLPLAGCDAPSETAFVGPPADPSPLRTLTGELYRDDSLYLVLKRNGVSEEQIAEVIDAARRVFDPRTESHPGDTYALTVDTSGVVQRLRYESRSAPERPLLVERRDGQLASERVLVPLTTHTVTMELEIEDNLANAVRSSGEGDALTDVLADDIFGATIDFRLQPRAGDRLGLIFEKVYAGEQFLRYGRVLLARYGGQVVSQTGVRFDLPDGHHDYYDPEGKSLARAFLLYALPYRGITSRFNRQRFHPVLKRTLPHLGTDYAARTGTRVWATARGRVTWAGSKGALGLAVIVQHANGYVTRYGHLSRILVRAGQYVQQQQLVGLVGATGRVTGPHLHYEVIHKGRHLNPESVNRGARGQPIPQVHMQAFCMQRDALLGQLDAALEAGRGLVAAAGAPAASLGE
ncbi:MAG: M23 family metallopeptidase [Candidatus Latescibacterota bacterium]